jgi:sialic acid synthase SpsE
MDIRRVVRRSLFAARAIPSGTVLTRELFVAKRPGGGIGPEAIDGLVGKRAVRDIAADEMLRPEDLIG